MKIKKFQGKTFKEVLEKVKEELGPDAVILSTMTKKDSLREGSIVEITAAVDKEEEVSFRGTVEQREKGQLQRDIEKIRTELMLLRECVAKLFPTINDSSKGGLYSLMIKSGIEPNLALLLLERVSTIDELRGLIEREIKVTDREFDSERGFILFGLPGVGKTTTINKIAQVLREKGHRLLILSLDQRISAVAALKETGIKLKCDTKVIRDTRELYRLVHKEIERTKILIDTPGDRELSYAFELRELMKDVPIKKCLLLDASMDMASSSQVLRSTDLSRVDCIAFSKVDLSCSYGNMYNLSVYSGKPLSFLTSGSISDRPKILPPRNLSTLILGGMREN